MPFITGIEADIAARFLAAGPSYLLAANGGTVRGVADIGTAMDLVITPPAVIFEFAGETAQPPHVIGVPQRQLTRLNWDLFCIAQSFSFSGGGRIDDGLEKGAYTLLDDVFDTLEGFLLPSQSTRYVSRLFYSGASRFALGNATVTYVSRWYCDVLRQGP